MPSTLKLAARLLAAIILVALSINSAWAWSGQGHMTVAAIAYRDLSPAERQKFDAILASHPRFQSWQSSFPASVSNLYIQGWLYAALAASLWARPDP